MPLVLKADDLDRAIADLQDVHKKFLETPVAAVVVAKEERKVMKKEDRRKLIIEIADRKISEYVQSVIGDPLGSYKESLYFSKKSVLREIEYMGFRASEGTIARDCNKLVGEGVLRRGMVANYTRSPSKGLVESIDMVKHLAREKEFHYHKDTKDAWVRLASSLPENPKRGGLKKLHYNDRMGFTKHHDYYISTQDLRRLLKKAYPDQLPEDWESGEFKI